MCILTILLFILAQKDQIMEEIKNDHKKLSQKKNNVSECHIMERKDKAHIHGGHSIAKIDLWLLN